MKSKLVLIACVIGLLGLAGCKMQQQMQTQITDLETKVTDTQHRVTAMDADLKKANFEIGQMKSLIAKLGDTVVNLQRVEEERQKKAAEDAAKAAAMPKRKAPGGKKRHQTQG
jgi:outer membrane murein-binding lipoprotein Lpp